MIPSAPCKDCENKCVGCHGKCEAYNQYKQDQAEYKRLLKVQDEINAYQKVSCIRSRQAQRDKSKWRRKGYASE